MLLFLYFFIGHLIGDFLFQTSQLVRWKHQSRFGILFHVILVFIATVFVFIPYLQSSWTWGALFLNAGIHYFIDKTKVDHDHRHKPMNPLPAFWLDQAAHILTFSLILLFLPPIQPTYFTETWWFEYYSQINLLLYIAGFLFFSYFLDILYFMNRLKEGKREAYTRSYYSMIVHTFVFALLFTLFWGIGRFYFKVF